MISRLSRIQLVRAACVASVFTVAALIGCSSSKNQQSSATPPVGAPAAKQASPLAQNDVESTLPRRTAEANEPEATSADILARKTQSYANTLAPLLDDHARPENGLNTAEPLDETPVPAAKAPTEVKRAEASEVVNVAPPEAPKRDTVVTDAVPQRPVTGVNSAAAPRAKSPNVVVANATVSDADDAIKAAATAVQPPAAVAPRQPAVDGLIGKLEKQAKDDPLDASAQLDLQLLRFLQGAPTPDMSMLASLPQEDQQTLSVLLDGLANFRSVLKSEENPLNSQKVKPLLDMADRLKGSSDLTIDKLVVYSILSGFGQYEPIEPARFAHNTAQQIKIYCEIANFTSQLNERSIWETKLTYSASLFEDTENGLEVWQGKPAEIDDLCRKRRTDFFLKDLVDLPALPIGGYLFKVTVVDQNANRVAEASVPIQIVAK